MTNNSHIIRSSNLNLRFYLKDGWTPELLKLFLKKGSIEHSAHFDSDHIENRYYTLSAGTEIDFTKLSQLDIKVERTFDDFPSESDESFIKRMI